MLESFNQLLPWEQKKKNYRKSMKLLSANQYGIQACWLKTLGQFYSKFWEILKCELSRHMGRKGD